MYDLLLLLLAWSGGWMSARLRSYLAERAHTVHLVRQLLATLEGSDFVPGTAAGRLICRSDTATVTADAITIEKGTLYFGEDSVSQQLAQRFIEARLLEHAQTLQLQASDETLPKQICSATRPAPAALRTVLGEPHDDQ